MSTITSKFDWLGIVSASLCSIHCIAMPFIVLLQTSDFFHLLSYPFLILSFFGAVEGTKHSESRRVLRLIWVGFSIMAIGVVLEDVNEHIGHLSYLGSALLIAGHLLNIRLCKKCN